MRDVLISNGVEDGDVDIAGSCCVEEGLDAILSIGQGECEDFLELDKGWRLAIEPAQMTVGEYSRQGCHSRWRRGFRRMSCVARCEENFAAEDGSR